jgi:hypothetical protein
VLVNHLALASASPENRKVVAWPITTQLRTFPEKVYLRDVETLRDKNVFNAICIH